MLCGKTNKETNREYSLDYVCCYYTGCNKPICPLSAICAKELEEFAISVYEYAEDDSIGIPEKIKVFNSIEDVIDPDCFNELKEFDIIKEEAKLIATTRTINAIFNALRNNLGSRSDVLSNEEINSILDLIRDLLKDVDAEKITQSIKNIEKNKSLRTM